MCNATGGWFWLHTERSCVRDGCKRPAYLGGLCGFCFAGAEAAERAVALLIHRTDQEVRP